MRILFVSGETPLAPAGGIATYLQFAATALQDAGHDVFLFTWTTKDEAIALKPDTRPFHDQNTHVEIIDWETVRRATPVRLANLSLSTWLSDRIGRVMQDWQIDVVEANDWQAPCLTLFQAVQTSAQNQDFLLSTFNHGHMDPFFEADHMQASPAQQLDNMNERQQCRVSDVVIAPSEFAKTRLTRSGIKTPIDMVREPYVFRHETDTFTTVTPEVEYMGRISMSKGMDKLIYCANILDEIMPLSRVRLMGRTVDPPFRVNTAESYVRARLHPRLRDKVEFAGFMDRDAVLASLTPGAIAPSLGEADTFSYACVEGIDAGHMPLVRQGVKGGAKLCQ